MQLFHGNQLMELFHGIILWNHFIISKHRNTVEHEQYDLTAFFHSMTFLEKAEGTIMVWLNTRKQNRGFPADRSEMFLLYLRLYDRHMIVLLFFQTIIIDDDW